jgi:hypothetical protein
MRRGHKVLAGYGVAIALSLAFWTAALANASRPPFQYQGDATVTVHFTNQNLDWVCRQEGATRGVNERIEGCQRGGEIWVSNPCRANGWYADLQCHEKAHVLGWRHD